MIVVISNRNLKGPLDGKSKPFSFLGKDMGNNGNVYARVVNRNSKLKLYSEQEKAQLFDDIVSKMKAGDARLNRPWVVFLHGNNQTTGKNIGKAIDIEKHHKVNVIAFSWPSQPYTGDDDKLLRTLKKEALKKIIRAIGGNAIVNNLLSKGYEKAEGFWRNYTMARMNAETSPADFSHALKVVDQHFVQQAGRRLKLSFICHSLGNYLLQNTVVNNTFPLKFSNIILHQADANAVGHEKWVKKLHSKSRRIIITTNQYDYVLLGSNFYNRRERLGQTKHRFNCSRCTYVDFSDANNTSDDNEHEFFRLHHRASRGIIKTCTNPEIYTLLDDLYNSKAPRLSKNAGFGRIPGKNNVYRLCEYIDPVDDEISYHC